MMRRLFFGWSSLTVLEIDLWDPRIVPSIFDISKPNNCQNRLTISYGRKYPASNIFAEQMFVAHVCVILFLSWDWFNFSVSCILSCPCFNCHGITICIMFKPSSNTIHPPLIPGNTFMTFSRACAHAHWPDLSCNAWLAEGVAAAAATPGVMHLISASA